MTATICSAGEISPAPASLEASAVSAALKGRAASVPLRMSGCVNIDSAAGAQLVSLLRKVLANVRASE